MWTAAANIEGKKTYLANWRVRTSETIAHFPLRPCLEHVALVRLLDAVEIRIGILSRGALAHAN